MTSAEGDDYSAPEEDGFGGPSTVPDTLWVVGVGSVESGWLETVASETRELYPLDVRVHSELVGASELGEGGPPTEPVDGLDLARTTWTKTGHTDVLAVTDLDIEHDGDWVFGISALQGSLAAVSTARLGDPDLATFDRRLRAQALRHVSHLLGKGTCPTDGCLFSPADSRRELDKLDTEPCRDCRDEIERLREQVDVADSRGEGGYELTHDLVNGARFWAAVGGYLLALFLSSIAALSLLEALPLVGIPSSDAGTLVFLVIMVIVAWELYRTGRRWVGRGGRAIVDALR